MNKSIRKIIAVLAALLLVGAMSTNAFALFGFAVDPKMQLRHADGRVTSCTSFSSAVNDAVDGDTLMIAGDLTNLTVTGGVTITKKITFTTGRGFGGNKKYMTYTGTSAPLFTVESGAVLTITDADIIGNSNASLPCGGFVYVKKGGTLVLDGKTGSEVLIKNFKLTAQGSSGGAVYAEQGGRVIVNGVTFEGNFAGKGADIYAEQKTDVTVADGVTMNAAYGESVEISTLNLVLTGEIGLVFHTAVPEKYLGGTFVLTCPTGDTVTYNIGECGKDAEGRYLAKYNLSAVELSEPVTLTVCDENGDTITSKTKSAEEYGRALLADVSSTVKEKNVAKSLLNYGHFAQTACAEYNDWVIGEKYTETAKYADLTTSADVFEPYEFSLDIDESDVTALDMQLRLDYKIDMFFHVNVNGALSVTVNGETVEAEPDTEENRYIFAVKGISALDLTKEYTIVINENTILKVSALSYCNIVMKQNNENCIDAAKALYEFYAAVKDYNK